MSPKILVEKTPLEAIPDRLPAMVANLSMGRAQIVVDQIRSAIEDGNPFPDRFIWITVSGTSDDVSSTAIDTPSHASLIAIQSQSGMDRKASDAATLLHACQMGGNQSYDLLEALGQSMDAEFRSRGIQFVQWATDAIPENSAADPQSDKTHAICRLLGFQQLATLRYLTVKLDDETKSKPTNGKATSVNDRFVNDQSIQLRPVESDRASQDRFAALVEETYIETLDCPRLNQFRCAADTLKSYQAVDSYRPNRWYTVHQNFSDESGKNEQPVGVVMMAGHASTSDSNENHTSELVYMALVPSARRAGLGRPLFQCVIDEATQANSVQLVLAVDEENLGGRAVYENADQRREAMALVLRETVWGKSI